MDLSKTAILKFVTKMWRHCEQEERDSDEAVHWDSACSRLLSELGSRMGQHCSHRAWLQAVHEGSNKTRFEYCKNSKDSVTYVRAIQGHTGGNMISPELIGSVEIPNKGKEFVFHRACSYNMKYTLNQGHIAGGKEKRWKTINLLKFFLPNPLS